MLVICCMYDLCMRVTLAIDQQPVSYQCMSVCQCVNMSVSESVSVSLSDRKK